MARRYYTVLQDATIYEEFPRINTGFDEILEIGKRARYSSSWAGFDHIVALENKIVRSLIQLDESEISASIVAGDIDPAATFYLNLKIANAINFQRNQVLEFHPVTQSWTEGTGYFAQDIKNPEDGASWISRSLSDGLWPAAGANFVSGTDSIGHSFGKQVGDIRVDITNLVDKWVSGTIPNNGLACTIPATEESSSVVETNLKFFSSQTHTIHPPLLEVVWNNQTINTAGSGLNPAPEEYQVFVPNAKPFYTSGSVSRVRLGVRPTSLLKSFTDRFRFSNQYFFPSESFIGIRDEGTREFVIPFDDGGRISADQTSSYYDMRVENMYINRTYRFYVKTLKPWGFETIDTGMTFEVK